MFVLFISVLLNIELVQCRIGMKGVRKSEHKNTIRVLFSVF